MKDRAADRTTLVIAIVIAAIVRADGVVLLVGAYAGAWLLVNAARVVGWPREAPAVPGLVVALVCGLVLVVPVRDLASRWGALLEHEGLARPSEHIADRLALEADPAIAPGLVSGDRPQTFFVRASGSHVRVRLGEGLAWIEAEGMGQGVFRLEYDPRVHGTLDAAAHETEASIEVDGSESVRPMLAVTPQPHPRWPRTSPDRARACVPSEETDEVLVIHVGGEPEHVTTLDGPSDCAIGDDGTLFVAHRYASEVLRVDATGARAMLEVGVGAAAIDLLGDAVCVAHEGSTPVVRCLGIAPLALEGTPLFLARAPGTASLVLATRSPAAIHRIELVNGSLVLAATRSLTAPAAHLSLDTTIELALGDFDEAGRPELGNHFVQDRVASFDLATLALLDDHPTAWRTDRQDHAGDVDRGASPMGVSRSPRGTRWVAFAGTDEIEEIGGSLAAPRAIDTARFAVSAPFSVVELADGSLVVTSPSSGLVVILARDGSLVRSIALAQADAQLLATDPASLQLRFGERAFYEATRSGVSCQSCHLHGGTDGARHNIGGRIAAPTLDVRGLIGTSPYLRDGSYPRLRDLHEVAVTEYRGYREQAGDRGATLEAWMRALPPPPTFERRDAARERQGLAVFFRAGCPECHAPPAFTSLGLHAIQAVFPDAPARTEGRLLDVPSLRGLARSAPYLYDGRAETLEAVFEEHNASDRHGHTRGLSPDDVRALTTFLRSL